MEQERAMIPWEEGLNLPADDVGVDASGKVFSAWESWMETKADQWPTDEPYAMFEGSDIQVRAWLYGLMCNVYDKGVEHGVKHGELP